MRVRAYASGDLRRVIFETPSGLKQKIEQCNAADMVTSLVRYIADRLQLRYAYKLVEKGYYRFAIDGRPYSISAADNQMKTGEDILSAIRLMVKQLKAIKQDVACSVATADIEIQP